MLRARGGERIKVFGGGGGVIVPEEIAELERYGVEKIYSPQDGQRLGLQGMIDDMIARCVEGAGVAAVAGRSPVGEWVDELSKHGLPRFYSRGGAGANDHADAARDPSSKTSHVDKTARADHVANKDNAASTAGDANALSAPGVANTANTADPAFLTFRRVAQLISAFETGAVDATARDKLSAQAKATTTPILGITGTGGAGKSSLTDELIRRFRLDYGDAPHHCRACH